MTRSTRRGPWLPEEDGTLLQLVRSQGPNNWVRISQHMQHRSPKQCRERYHQNLKPTLNHEPISAQEGELIEQLVQEMGKRWAEIARRLGNRSDNAVKNWWNGSMNRRKRHNLPQSNASRAVGHRSQPIPATRLPLPAFLQSPPSSHDGFPRQHFPTMLSLDRTRSRKTKYEPSRTPTYTPELHLPPHQPEHSASLPTAHLPTGSFAPSDHRLPTLQHYPASAPSSLQATPDPLSARHLHPHAPSPGLRPPPLESRPSSQLDWQLPRIGMMEPAIVSPAATAYSTTSLHQAPSLVSDNQSHCSISPKTISSPRPGLPAPIDTSTQEWAGMHRRNSFNSIAQERRPRQQDEGYVSALPASAVSEGKNLDMPLDPILHRNLESPAANARTGGKYSPSTSSPIHGRDTRMTLSNLLD